MKEEGADAKAEAAAKANSVEAPAAESPSAESTPAAKIQSDQKSSS
jgi:hypothetical protein